MGRGSNNNSINSLGSQLREKSEISEEERGRAWNEFFMYDYPSIEEGSEDMKYRDAAISTLEKAGYSLEKMREIKKDWNDYSFLSRYGMRNEAEEKRLEEIEKTLRENGFNLENNLRVPAPEDQDDL